MWTRSRWRDTSELGLTEFAKWLLQGRERKEKDMGGIKVRFGWKNVSTMLHQP